MTGQEIRRAYLEYFTKQHHFIVPRALLVPKDDPTTLFTGSGMQPLLPYLLGQEHPGGTRLASSQTCLRSQDIDEVGDNRHTTFFEMLGNWSLGDYSKRDQIHFFWEFLTKIIKLDPNRLYVSCYIGDQQAEIVKDTKSASIWQSLFQTLGLNAKIIDIGSEDNGYQRGEQDGRIFYYGEKNWWCRAGSAKAMPINEPGGPDSEVFYLFPDVRHNQDYGKYCHVNCDCGRYMEIGNSVFMEYVKTNSGFQFLPKKNIDFGGGLERISAAAINSADVYRISLMWPIIEKLEEISGSSYDNHMTSMRIITDHMRAAFFLAVDGVVPSNKEQGYVMRRLLRRTIRYAYELGIEQNFLSLIVPVIIKIYQTDFPEVTRNKDLITNILSKEEKVFRQTLKKGLNELKKRALQPLSGEDIFQLYDTYGFPVELSTEEALIQGFEIENNWRRQFEQKMEEQKARSRTAIKGQFKGGLAGYSLQHKKYHTATHLMYQSLRQILGDHVIQRGSNITEERLRFDFSHPQKLTNDQIHSIEELVNLQISNDLEVSWQEYKTEDALNKLHALGAFGDRYGQTVKCYKMQGKNDKLPFSLEICGGPHVEHTKQLAEGGRSFKIIKEEASAAGVRRIKAVLI